MLTAKDALLKFRKAKARYHKYLLKTGALSFMAWLRDKTSTVQLFFATGFGQMWRGNFSGVSGNLMIKRPNLNFSQKWHQQTSHSTLDLIYLDSAHMENFFNYYFFFVCASLTLPFDGFVLNTISDIYSSNCCSGFYCDLTCLWQFVVGHWCSF